MAIRQAPIGQKAMKGIKRTATGKAARVTKAGQNNMSTGLCIATLKDGRACPNACGAPGVPYCAQHMRDGDPALKVVKHPLAGKTLIAARTLPKGYRISLWGPLMRKKDMTQKSMEWAFDLSSGWFLDPTNPKAKGSFARYCSCPGPGEIAVVSCGDHRIGKGDKWGSWMFHLNQRLPKNYQVTMQYGNNSKGSDEFFECRGIKRLDVGTKSYPALRRKVQPGKGKK